MPWFKIDDGFYDNPKVKAIPRPVRMACLGLWVSAGTWSAKHLTDGRVPAFMVEEFGADDAQAAELVACGLWREVPDGWRFVHWRKSQDGDYRRNIRKSVRAAVMARDERRCVLCGSTQNLSLDHIVRYRDDGPDTVDNLRVLCMPCNLERG